MLTLTSEQLDWLCERIEDPPVSPQGGRPRANKRDVIRGIFWILDNGAKWKDLPREFGSKSTVHRRFKTWVEDGVFERLMHHAAARVEQRGDYKLYECFIDGTFSRAKGGGDGVGATKAGKGVKIMVLVDARGVPVAVDTCSASPHECTLVQELFDFMLTSSPPEKLIGDRAYDSDKLDAELAARGTELMAPHRRNRKHATQDGRKLRRYRRRWKVERLFAWLMRYRRIVTRWEHKAENFLGFLHLACLAILLKRL